MIGAGTRFLSGIGYYTMGLTNAIAGEHKVSAIRMRRLLPSRLYPGRNRVGRVRPNVSYAGTLPVYDGVDWFWVPSIFRAVAFLMRRRPEYVVFQW